jgi:hypothetical protein
LRQGAHLGCHHGKATPGISGAGGFNAGIQRQQVGLEGNLIDDADDAADFLG